MRENEPVLLVLSVCDGEIILEKGEILSEKRQCCSLFAPIAHMKPQNLLTLRAYYHQVIHLESSARRRSRSQVELRDLLWRQGR
jgi:hypothetical protein